MLQNKYLVAKIGVDTAENEPPKVRAAPVLPMGGGVGHDHGGGGERGRGAPPGAAAATTNHSFRGSFSAVSTLILQVDIHF